MKRKKKKVLNNENKNENKEYTTTEAVRGLPRIQCLPSGGEVRQTLVKTVTEVSFWARARVVGEMTQGHCISLQSVIVKSTLTTVLTPSHDQGSRVFARLVLLARSAGGTYSLEAPVHRRELSTERRIPPY